MAALAALLLTGYGVALLHIGQQWARLPDWHIPPDWMPHQLVTIIVPARNEAANILTCLRSLVNQDYPPELLEIVVIDDHSTDDTATLVEQAAFPCVSVVRLSSLSENGELRSSKKTAISTGVALASGDLILTTDADCVAQVGWVRQVASFHESGGWKFITGPVGFREADTAFAKFQQLDYLGMMGVTAAGMSSGQATLANGANLAFAKSAFESVGGYSGTLHLASGDDVHLLEKIRQAYPGQVAFLKSPEAVVYTLPAGTAGSFLQQRLRWATKTLAQAANPAMLALQVQVFLLYWALVLALVAAILGWSGAAWVFAILLLGKAALDWWYLGRLARFFSLRLDFGSFVSSFAMHTIYFAGIGLLSLFKKDYIWKGRRSR
jgi:cellulose synthase/poly-beta-1,6-N-acetylglucosamine synthase-like glycosyltransferase